MKRKIIFILSLLLGLGIQTFSQKPAPAIAAQWDKILAGAKNDNKIILLDFYTSWCGPCKMMDQNVFPDKMVSQTIKQYYTVIKVDAEKDELGRVLAARYMVRSYPTFMIIDPSLNVLSKDAGYKPAEEFNTWLVNVANNKVNKVGGFSQKKYLDFPEFYLSRFVEKKDLGAKPDSNVVAAYLSQQKDLTSEISWAVMNTFEMPNKYFKYFKANYQIYKNKYGNSIEGKMAYAMFPELDKAIKTKNTEAFVAVLNQIPKYFDDPGKQQSTYLFNIPREDAFFLMKVNFLDTAKTITSEDRMEASRGLLMEKNMPKEASDKAIGWLINYPDIEKSNDLYVLMSLASAYHLLGAKDKVQAFFKKGEEIGKNNEESKSVVEFYKKKLNL